jgi:hypothetical protein
VPKKPYVIKYGRGVVEAAQCLKYLLLDEDPLVFGARRFQIFF